MIYVGLKRKKKSICYFEILGSSLWLNIDFKFLFASTFSFPFTIWSYLFIFFFFLFNSFNRFYFFVYFLSSNRQYLSTNYDNFLINRRFVVQIGFKSLIFRCFVFRYIVVPLSFGRWWWRNICVYIEENYFNSIHWTYSKLYGVVVCVKLSLLFALQRFELGSDDGENENNVRFLAYPSI